MLFCVSDRPSVIENIKLHCNVTQSASVSEENISNIYRTFSLSIMEILASPVEVPELAKNINLMSLKSSPKGRSVIPKFLLGSNTVYCTFKNGNNLNMKFTELQVERQ